MFEAKRPEYMTPEEAQKITNGWIEEIVAALPPHHKVLPKPARDAIIHQGLVKRYQRALDEGGRDKEALINHLADKDVMQWLSQREPRGQYDPKAVLRLDDDLCVFMAKATKDHVKQWRDYMARNPEQGCNFGNLLYADTRLTLWKEEKTLAELEARSRR
jgi:hypothetical protein